MWTKQVELGNEKLSFSTAKATLLKHMKLPRWKYETNKLILKWWNVVHIPNEEMRVKMTFLSHSIRRFSKYWFKGSRKKNPIDCGGEKKRVKRNNVNGFSVFFSVSNFRFDRWHFIMQCYRFPAPKQCRLKAC
jgi:hypothetical protein